MEEIYGLGIKRSHYEDYCIPMDLKDIDELFLQYPKKQILDILKQNDSVITETDENTLCIEKYINGKWKKDAVEIIDEESTLTFSFEELLNQEETSKKILNFLYNHFRNLLTKNYISNEMKQTIIAMQKTKEEFLNSLHNLKYYEERKIRVYLKKQKDIYKIDIPKQENRNPKTPNKVEVLEMFDYEKFSLERKAS